MNEQNNPPEKQDDEISLLDLFAVLIRYRRMILGGTLAAGVLCALVLYGGGAIQKSLRQEQEPAAVAALLGDPENRGPDSEYSWILDGNIWNLTYTIRVRNLPAYLGSYLRENFGENAADLLLYFRNVWYDTAFLADLHRQHTLWPPAAEIEDAAEYNGFFLELQKRDQNADSSPGKPQYARFGEVLIWNTTARNPDEPEPDVLSVTLEKLPESAVVPYELDGTGHPPLAQEFISGIVQQANAQAAARGGADCLSLVNTFTGMAIDIERRRPVLANNTGGVSGAGIKPIAVRMVYEAAHAVSIPVIGMGGITCAEDAVEFLMAGAAAVQVGTQNFTDTRACPKIIAGLNEWCDRHNVASVASLTDTLQLN